MAPKHIPVLVLGAAEHGSLGIIRSLGRMGVPVYCMESSPRGPASYSRFCKLTFNLNLSDISEELIIEKLCEIGQSFSTQVILIPTWDEIVLLLERNQEKLRPYYIFPEQPPGVLQVLTDKWKMTCTAKSLGIPVPFTAKLSSLVELEEFSKSGTFPCIVKRSFGNQRNGAPGALIAHDAAELRAAVRTLSGASEPNLVVQEFLAGENAWVFTGYFDRESQCVVGYTGRKLRQTPAHLGMMSLGVCADNPAIQESARRLLSNLKFTGIVDIDFCWDARDESYKILDVNPRVGASFRLFVGGNGVDVIRAMYFDAAGEGISFQAAPEGRKWMVERDFKSAFDLWREGSLSAHQWLRSLRNVDEFGYFAWDDLIPIVMILPYMLRRRRKATQRNTGQISTVERWGRSSL